MKAFTVFATTLVLATFASAETFNCVGKSDQLVISGDSISYFSDDYTFLNLKIRKKSGPYQQFNSVVETAVGTSSEGLDKRSSITLFIKTDDANKIVEFDLQMTNEGFSEMYPVFSCKGDAIQYGQPIQAEKKKEQSTIF